MKIEKEFIEFYPKVVGYFLMFVVGIVGVMFLIGELMRINLYLGAGLLVVILVAIFSIPITAIILDDRKPANGVRRKY